VPSKCRSSDFPPFQECTNAILFQLEKRIVVLRKSRNTIMSPFLCAPTFMVLVGSCPVSRPVETPLLIGCVGFEVPAWTFNALCRKFEKLEASHKSIHPFILFELFEH
jgi:hypothetical protein